MYELLARQVAGQGGRLFLELSCGDWHERLHVFSATTPLKVRAEGLLALALIPAMRYGSCLRLDVPLDATLYQSLSTLQDILTCWNPELRRVTMDVSVAEPRSGIVRPKRVAAFFTGGVDSFYTLLREQAEITDLVFVHGFDIALDDHALRQTTSQALHDVAQAFGKNLIEIESDLKPMLRRALRGRMSHGAALAFVAHCLPSDFGKVFIPSSFTYAKLFPWGSHPLLDPLWGSSRLKIVHHGAEADRVMKLAYIAKNDMVLRHLRVCLVNTDGAYNCGVCAKCIRTMVSLKIVGALEGCQAFDRPLDLDVIPRMRARGDSAEAFLEQNLAALARMATLDPELERLQQALRRQRRRSRWTPLLRALLANFRLRD